jgi:hypothetical protein
LSAITAIIAVVSIILRQRVSHLPDTDKRRGEKQNYPGPSRKNDTDG